LSIRSSQPHPSRFIYGDLAGLDLKGKKVAIFGLGDQGGYGDNFCDAMDELKTCFEGRGATVIGSVGTDSYEYDESKSVADGKVRRPSRMPARWRSHRLSRVPSRMSMLRLGVVWKL
jgi:flavodoxin